MKYDSDEGGKSDNRYDKPEKKSSKVSVKKSKIWSGSQSPSEKCTIIPKPQSIRFLNSFSQYVDNNEEFTEDEIIPDRIEGFYVFDYNILKIDEILRKKFHQDKKNKIKKYNDCILEENKKMACRQNMIERKQSLKKIAEYQGEITKHETDRDLKKYEERSKDILDEYKKLGSIKQVVSFVTNSKIDTTENPENEETQSLRHQLIFNYLEIARKYIGIDLIRQQMNDGSCPGCGNIYDEMELIEDEPGLSVCPFCGLEIIKVVKKSIYSDNNRVNNIKNNYEDRINFEKVIARYQGKQITKPDICLYEKLEEYFKIKGLPSSKEYCEMKLLPNGTKKGASRELMFEALANIGCSGYYDDINLICNIFFGFPLPDITHLEEEIMKDYDDFQRVYETLDKDGRKSSLNSQWKLYILLKRRGWPCKIRDFKIPTTPHIIEYHKTITKQVYELLGWNYDL